MVTVINEAVQTLGIEKECEELKTFKEKANRIAVELAIPERAK